MNNLTANPIGGGWPLYRKKNLWKSDFLNSGTISPKASVFFINVHLHGFGKMYLIYQ